MMGSPFIRGWVQAAQRRGKKSETKSEKTDSREFAIFRNIFADNSVVK